MRSKLLILTFLFLFFGASPVFAASVDAPSNFQSTIQIDQIFSIDSNLTNVQTGEVYFVKCRIGPSSSSLTEGQTYNPSANSWLSDTDAWIDMPTVATTTPTTNFSFQCKVKNSVAEGQKTIYTRACLKKSDGTCGTSFQSSSGNTFTAITQPTPTPSPTQTAAPSDPPQTTSSFTISNTPSQINFDQSFSVNINLSMPNSQNTDYYLKGAFKKADGTRYLGLTKIGSSWVEYGDDYSDQYKITTDSSGNWNGSIEVKPDTLDNDYKGSGEYMFKIGRFTSTGSGPSWSNNEATIKINDAGNTPSNSPSPQSTPKITPSASLIKSPSPALKPSPSVKISYQIASVAGVQTATPEAKVEVKDQKQTNPLLWVGSIFVIIGLGILGIIIFKPHIPLSFPHRRESN